MGPKSWIIAFCVLVGLAVLVPFNAANASICPSTSYTNSDCGYILTIGVGGTVTGAAVPGANPYDGIEDALVGIVNNSGMTFTGGIGLQGSGGGIGIFDFDGDGICTYVAAAYCGTAPTGYEGPISTFSNIHTVSISNDAGTVNVAGLGAGQTTYFSLEGSPAAIGGGIIVTPVPEPLTLSLFGAGLLALVGVGGLRRRKADGTACA